MNNKKYCFLESSLLQNLIINLLFLTTVSSHMNLFSSVSLSTVEIIRNNGYEAEIHHTITEDGYILELHRIPKSKNGQMPTRNYPVFIHHGILGSSADWVIGGAKISLPMQLADSGYDVWLANCRGNTYSRQHRSMTSDQEAFWNFNLHEIGTYDLPAAFDYILNKTNASQFHYIGYSMGTCVFYIMATERPEYQPKIRSQISLAPVAYLSNMRSVLKYIAPYAKVINIMAHAMSKGTFLPQSRMQKILGSTVCQQELTQKLLCLKYFIYLVCGSDPHYFDTKLVPIIMEHFPAGTSSNIATHFAQFILKGTFGQYDYGPTMNLHIYNSTKPPKYNLKSIQVPITLIYGENDLISDVKDVMKLSAKLPNIIDIISVKNMYFNHVDFLWSLNVTNQINNPVVGILKETDVIDWEYSRPNRSVIHKTKNENFSSEDLSNSIQNVYFVPSLDSIIENIDAIIASNIPRSMNENDIIKFKEERELQKLLFGNLVQFAKTAKTKYSKFQDDVIYEVYNWTENVVTNVKTGVSNVQNEVEMKVKNTTILIKDQAINTHKSVNNKMTNVKNSVVYGIVKSRSLVTDSVNKAEQSVIDGIAKAKQSIVGSIDKTENYLNAVVNNVEQSAKNSLEKVFWFFK